LQSHILLVLLQKSPSFLILNLWDSEA
jgi:hypothetical protein